MHESQCTDGWEYDVLITASIDARSIEGKKADGHVTHKKKGALHSKGPHMSKGRKKN